MPASHKAIKPEANHQQPEASSQQPAARRRTTMLILKYLLLTTGYGLLTLAAAIALNNLYKVVQYRRQLGKTEPANQPDETSISTRAVDPEAPAKPQLHWTTAKWAGLGACLPIILAGWIAVLTSRHSGTRGRHSSDTRAT